jgi:hypothetical protein
MMFLISTNAIGGKYGSNEHDLRIFILRNAVELLTARGLFQHKNELFYFSHQFYSSI